MTSSRLFNEMNSVRSCIIGVAGSGKAGKSTQGHSFAYYVPNFRRRPHYLFESDDVDCSAFPGYKVIDDFDKVQPGSVLVVEDLIRHFQSRGSGQQVMLPPFLGSMSQKDIILIFSVQSMADADLALFRLQNFILCNKVMYDEDIQFERPEFRALQTHANYEIRKFSELHPEHDIRSLVYSSRYSEVSVWPMPDWWSDDCAYYLRDVPVCRKKEKGRGVS